MQAHLRASRGNQHIIEADDAAAYFGPCSTASSSASAPPCARPRGFNLDADLFSLTPYHRFKESYRYKGAGGAGGCGSPDRRGAAMGVGPGGDPRALQMLSGACCAPSRPVPRPPAPRRTPTSAHRLTVCVRACALADSPHDKRPPGLGLWIALEAETVVDVHHFKWHAGLLNNMKDRMEWYRCGVGGRGSKCDMGRWCGANISGAAAATPQQQACNQLRSLNLPAPPCRGDCELGVKEEPACTPRLAHWRDAALTHAALAGGQPIDTAAMGCARPAKDVQANTTYAGLAWEWMEDWLNVHEGSSGGNIPKQYRLGQFKQGAG